MAESSFELVFVSPNIAKILLKDLYDEQRPYRDRLAQKYAQDMADGRWVSDNPQPIVISSTGKVIDGQHRLNAVIISGKTVPMYIARGANEDTYRVIDSGATRTVTDRISMPQKSNCAALAKRVVALDKGYGLKTALDGTITISQQEVLEVLDREPEHLLEVVKCAGRIRKDLGKCGAVSAYAAVLYAFEVVHGEGTLERIEQGICEPTRTSLAFQKYVMRLYSGSSAPKPYIVASGFVMFCDALFGGYECLSYNKRESHVKALNKAYGMARVAD